MEKLIKKYIYIICVLEKYSGVSFIPFDIVRYIIQMYRQTIKVNVMCGNKYSILSFNDEWYSGNNGRLQKFKLDIDDVIYCDKYHTSLVRSSKKYISSEGQLIPDFTDNDKFDKYWSYRDENIMMINRSESHLVIISDKMHRIECHTEFMDGIHMISIPNVISVACGGYHIIILTADGEIYVDGNNKYGQLGLDRKNSLFKLRKVDIGLKSIGSISCGAYHTIFVTGSNEVYSCGLNKGGQLGLSDYADRWCPTKISLEKVISTSCGEYHTIALTISGDIYVWGSNYHGQLGLNELGSHKCCPTKINLRDIISVKCGGFFTMIVTKFSDVYAWGSNHHGELNLGDHIDRHEPTLLRF